ncbi:hypothetical protein [Thiomonas intermedia]|uniref:hypothetical protein n=1 Tax=Thiomonas intermedia TaxID=926 RepID=UPI0009A53280|nr:hypothetical protein [Thiomonas intermedia]
MTKLETIKHLPSSAQLQAAAQDLHHLPQAIVEQLAPLLPNIEQTLQAQREVIEILTQQATQHIAQTQAQALRTIQAQQQASQQALIDSLTKIEQQMNASQTLHKHTKAAVVQTAQAARQMQQMIRQAPPLTLPRAIALTLLGALLAAVLTLLGMHVSDRPVPRGAQQQT